jgi:hypothetical protein
MFVSFRQFRVRPSAVLWLAPLATMVLGTDMAFALAGGELEVRVTDEETGQLIPVRMHLKDERGRPVMPPGLLSWKDHFIVPGKAVLRVRPGKYTFELERGPEYRMRTGQFTVNQGDADNQELTLQRFVDMKKEGWWSGDLHIHRAPKDIELLMRAEDLHVAPVITWWNDTNAWASKRPPDKPLVRFDQDRCYHLLAGEDERGGGALLFFNLRQPLPIAGSQREYPSACDFLKPAREQTGVHVDIEKPFWWDVPVWIASGMVDSVELCHNHMQREGVLGHEAWGKPRDKSAYPDPLGNGRWTLDIYHQLLNCGLRIPPSAGSASGVLPNPVGYNRVYVHCGEELDYEKWWEHLRAGQVVVTNGPLIREPRFNGELPGHVFQAPAGQTVRLQATLNLSLREPVDYLEIVKDGQVVHEVRLDDWAKSDGQLPTVEFRESGWLLVQAITSNPRTFRFASTGPVYVEVGGQRRISKQAAQFFLDWVYERARQIQLPDQQQRESVLTYHRAARDYWQRLVNSANAE